MSRKTLMAALTAATIVLGTAGFMVARPVHAASPWIVQIMPSNAAGGSQAGLHFNDGGRAARDFAHSNSAWIDAVLSRQGVTGKRGERAAVDSGDIAAASGGDPLNVTGLWFSDPSVRQIAFTMTGYFPAADGFLLTLADGTTVPPSGSGTETGTSPTGDVGQGANSFVSFAFRDFDQLPGTVRLTFGEPGSILRDRWKVGFAP